MPIVVQYASSTDLHCGGHVTTHKTAAKETMSPQLPCCPLLPHCIGTLPFFPNPATLAELSVELFTAFEIVTREKFYNA